MARSPNCPACRGALEEGFIPDSTQGQVLQANWHPGPPQDYRFFGIPAGKKVTREGLVPIEAWRCSACGLVQLYAPKKPSKK